MREHEHRKRRRRKKGKVVSTMITVGRERGIAETPTSKTMIMMVMVARHCLEFCFVCTSQISSAHNFARLTVERQKNVYYASTLCPDCLNASSSFAFPVMSLGCTIFGEIFAYVTVF